MFALTTKNLIGTRMAVLGAGAVFLVCAVAQAGQQTSAAPASTSQTSTSKTSTSSAFAATNKTPVHKKHHRTTASTSTSKSTGGASSAHAASSPSSASSHKGTSRRKKIVRTRGQQKIDSDRVQEIQEALIREHYLSGEATGKWNDASEAAMRKYQGDHGWQTKTVPDSRALIKLGLGPSHDHLLNPESAMTTGPDASQTAASSTIAPHSDPASPVSTPAGKAPSESAPTSTPTSDSLDPQ